MKLEDIAQGNWLSESAIATPAIPAISERREVKSIAAVAEIALATPPKENLITAFDPFHDRMDRLHDAGLSKDDAALMALRLKRRDIEGDDRHVCAECRHLSGGVNEWRCSQWQKRQHNGPEIPSDLVVMILHRCGGFIRRLETRK
jgi:hypothetical protein